MGKEGVYPAGCVAPPSRLEKLDSSDIGVEDMPNSASAAKKVRQQERNRIRNRTRKSELKTETRKFLDAVHANDIKAAAERFRTLTKNLDQTAAKGTLHKNTVARRKSRLAKRLTAMSAKKA